MAALFPRIIHISDLHISSSDTQLDWPDIIVHHNTGARIAAINKFFDNCSDLLKSTIIIHTGDLTDSGDDEDYVKARDQFLNYYKGASPYRLYNVAGNHDYFNHGINDPHPPFGPNPDSQGGQNNTRKDKFISYVTQYDDYPHIIEVNNDPNVGWIVLLDSMRDIFGKHATVSKGLLGAAQLDRLEEFLNSPETLQKRGVGARIVVALHHSPFSDDSLGCLDDRPRFLEVIKGKIDCLLFGHTTPRGKLSEGSHFEFNGWQTELKIPLISCVNLQWMDIPMPGEVLVLDIEKNQRELYLTDGQGPIISKGSYPVFPRLVDPLEGRHRQVAGCYRIGPSRIDEMGRGIYQVYLMTTSQDFDHPIHYSFVLDPNTADAQVIPGPTDFGELTISIQDCEIIIGGDGRPYQYDHVVKITASDHLGSVEANLPVELPRPSIHLLVRNQKLPNISGEIQSIKSIPKALTIKPAGLTIEFDIIVTQVSVKAVCSGFLGELKYKWKPTPAQGDGTDTAIYTIKRAVVDNNFEMVVGVEVTDQLNQNDVRYITIASPTVIGRFIPASQFPVAIRRVIPWHVNQKIQFDDPITFVANIGGINVALAGDIIHNSDTIKVANNPPIKLASLSPVRQQFSYF